MTADPGYGSLSEQNSYRIEIFKILHENNFSIKFEKPKIGFFDNFPPPAAVSIRIAGTDHGAY
jgi:hypothetical protein